MAKKKDTTNQPWLWVDEGKDLNQENVENSYRLNFKQHSTCRKNCRSNPRCLTGFGESSWMQPIAKDYLELQRSAGTFVGLKNLGNTCYINCFLQLWFHNGSLREALYLWDAFKDPAELAKRSISHEWTDDNYEPHSSVAHLQVLFADMEFGLEKYCDPENFCRSLSIDVELQQDAQEFGKLYMTCLEETFGNAENEFTRNVIKCQFRGQYCYATTCSKCLNISRRQSDFYELELNIKNKRTVLDSLNEFVQEDNLLGDDKYFCEICNQKQEATRRIQLEILPQVLQLQLLRYYYDMKTLSKKKITQGIAFPDVLDMSQYVGKADGSEIYSLQAVLMHGGTSANTGHYYAHINTQDGWYVFDDITVKKQKQLSLINDEPLAKDGEKKTPKIKGSRSSSAAYMIVYCKQGVNDSPMPSSDSLKETKTENFEENSTNGTCQIHADQNFSSENCGENNFMRSGIKIKTTELSVMENDALDQEKQRKIEKLPKYLQNLISKRVDCFMQSVNMQANDYEEKFEHRNFVENFFNILTPGPSEKGEFIHIDAILNLKNFQVPPLDNTPLLCSHGGLDVNKYKDYKLVSSSAVDLYLNYYEGGPRIPYSQLCYNCVEKYAVDIRKQAAIKADIKSASQLLKFVVTCDEPGFWVGKKSLKTWTSQIGPNIAEIDDNVVILDQEGEFFNSDITCPHGGLLHAEGERRLVTKQCWDLFRKYFPKCKEFDKNAEPCFLCKNDAQATQKHQRLQAQMELNRLSSLANERREIPVNVSYLISLLFVTAWRRYVRSALHQVLRDRPAPSSAFQSLLCVTHKLLLFDPSTDIDRVFTLSEEEWTTLKELYGLSNEIKVVKSDDGSICYNIGLCDDCIAELECQEDSYFGAKMYVYKVTNEVDEESLAQAEAVDVEVKKLGQKRKQAVQLLNGGPLKKLAGEVIRRSARSRTTKDETISFRIDKHTTLKELKIMICNRLSVFPCDQHLSLDGNDLDDLKVAMGLKDEEATFVKLRVPPCSTLRLLADEPSPELEALTECGPTLPEPGFKGTGLGGS